MIKPICKDSMILRRKAEPAQKGDEGTLQDLSDTLLANRERCVGMAANMIGVPKQIVAFFDEGKLRTMFNPKIVRSSMPYETEEGCLSWSGTRKVQRFQHVRVEYYDSCWRKKSEDFFGYSAQIVQHEIDHLFGKEI